MYKAQLQINPLREIQTITGPSMEDLAEQIVRITGQLVTIGLRDKQQFDRKEWPVKMDVLLSHMQQPIIIGTLTITAYEEPQKGIPSPYQFAKED